MAKPKTHSTQEEKPTTRAFKREYKKLQKVEPKKDNVDFPTKDTSGAPLAFRLRSGNGPLAFKQMGSSPAKMDPATMSMLMKAKDKKDEDEGKDEEGEKTEMIDMTTGL